MIRYVNTCKIPVALLSCLFPKLKQALECNNISHLLDAPSNNNEKNLGPANIDEQKLATISNFTPENRLLSELFSTFREVTFSKSEFPVGIPVLKTRYRYFGNQKENLYYLFKDKVDYALAYYFEKSETMKRNSDKFFSNLLMKPITKKLSYQNIDEEMEKLSSIPWGILKDI